MINKEKIAQKLGDYLKTKNMKQSRQRFTILETILKSEKHFTADDLYIQVKKANPNIGIATVYRTLNLLCESGICRELHFNDLSCKYEIIKENEHHDHLICLKCGKCIEIYGDEIEQLQKNIALDNHFSLKSHRMELYGYCSSCKED